MSDGRGIRRDDDADCTGVLAGDRQEHYYYAGWRLIETRNAAGGTLGQLVYGTQYIDEPVRFDRNLDVGGDNLCIETGGEGDASYYYHQDANFRVVALTGIRRPTGRSAATGTSGTVLPGRRPGLHSVAPDGADGMSAGGA